MQSSSVSARWAAPRPTISRGAAIASSGSTPIRAAKHGAEIHHSEPARQWSVDGDGVRVETEQGVYTARRLVITAGPWASELLTDLGLPLRVQRIVNVHFAPTAPEWFAPEHCPV